MAGGTLTNKSTLLQDQYGEGVNFVVNVKTRVLNRFPISPKKFDGNVIRENVGYAIPAGGLSLGPSAASVPAPSTSRHQETFIFHTYHYDTIQVDWDLERQTSGKHSYDSALSNELKNVAKFRPRDFERQIMSDGSGILCVSSTITSVTSANWTCVIALDQLPKFPVESRIEFWNGATNTAVKYDTPAQGYYTVASFVKNKSAGTATLTIAEASPGTNSPVTGAYIARDEAIYENGSAAGTNASREMNGLDIIIDDGNEINVKDHKYSPTDSTFQNISATTYGHWQSQIADGTDQYLNLDLIEDLASDIATHSSESPDSIRFIVTSYFQHRKYKAQLLPNERFSNTGNAGAFNAGTTTTFDETFGPDISNKPMIKSEFCPTARTYLVGSGIMHYDLAPWAFWDGDGSMWRMNQQGRPARVAHAFCIKAVGATRRDNHGRIENMLTS